MKHYDKIFLVASLIVLGLSSAFFFINEPKIAAEKAQTKKILAGDPAGEPWKNLDIEIKTEEPLEWPEVKAQDADGLWLFQVFTPPKIWVDKSGVFISQPPRKAEVDPVKTFPIIFSEIVSTVYPIKYTGDYGASLVQLLDTRTNKPMLARKGEEIVVEELGTGGVANKVKTGLTMVSFSKQRVKNDKNDTYEDIATIVLDDKNLGRQITIVSNKPTVLDDMNELVLKSKLNPSFVWKMKKAGEKTTLDGLDYEVKELDFSKKSAVVEQSKNGKVIQTVRVSADGNTVL